MPNTITLNESDVNERMVSYAGIQLERAPTASGSFALLVQIPYVADQALYTYVDATGSATDWYRTARYSAGGSLGPYSPPWPVSRSDLPGITLAEIEQATARRLGPYYRLPMDRQVPTTANYQRAYFPGLRSTVEQDLVTNLYLLRRGVDWQGNPVAVSADDRQRMVANYDPPQGMIEVDSPWSVAPAVGEVCEFHHLDPDQQLRPAVLGGLRRCFFEDRIDLGTGYIYEVDLTAQVPWLTDSWQVWRVQAAPFPSGFYGSPSDMPFKLFGQGGHIWLRLSSAWGAPYYGGVLLAALRPVWSLVNGLDTTDGPLLDTDLLEVDLDYAASAGHIEAWHQAPARMQAAAAGGLQATQAMAALEFTRQAHQRWPRRPDLWQMPDGFAASMTPLVVNV